MATNQFRSPIRLNIPAVPAGVPDELVDTIQGIFNSLRALQQAIGDYSGAGYTDVDYLLDNVTLGVYSNTIQVGNMQIAAVKANAALTAGLLVNLFDTGTELRARYAQANAMVTRAWGWALNTTTAPGQTQLVVLLSGLNRNFAGLTRGGTYWLSSTTPGGIQNTAPVAVGTIRQEVGLALDSSQMLVHISPMPIQN